MPILRKALEVWCDVTNNVGGKIVEVGLSLEDMSRLVRGLFVEE
jgi:hypothetical protein